MLVGLGNPGTQYKNTRHNAGFIAIDHFLSLGKLELTQKEKFLGEIGVFHHDKGSYIILKPTTFMNQSGLALKSVMNYYNITIEDVLIFVDDIYLDVGDMRLREQGGHGGQNGIKDIIEKLQTQAFKRVRLGIGVDERVPLDQYVLSPFKKSEIETIEDIKNRCAIIMTSFIEGVPFKDIMTAFNKKKRV